MNARPFFFALPLLLCGCAPSTQEGPLVVCSIYPEYEWAKAVIGDNPAIRLKLLQDNGADLHSFQPTVSDIISLSKADVFIYNGGESDEWVEKAFENVPRADQIRLNLLEELGSKAREEELTEGMSGETEEGVYDEHIWLSLQNAKVCVEAIEASLSKAYPAYADSFRDNALSYGMKLDALDESFAEAVGEAKRNVLLFADRFPFLYMVKDYGIDYYAAFSGCSAEAEARVSTITFLAKKVDELGLRHICVLEQSDGRLASTIREATSSKDQKTLSFDSMQSTSLKNATSYIEAMEHNLKTLKEALS